jgi:hypothetical protein
MVRKSQKGFAIVEALLIVILLGIVGFTGYYVWHSKQQTDKTLNAANNSSQAPSTQTIKNFEDCKKSAGSKILTTYPEQCVAKDGKTFTDTSQQAGAPYLAIKEWGVQIPLAAGIEDAYYRYDPRDTGYAYLSLASLKSTDCAADATTTGVIVRFAVDDVDPISGEKYIKLVPAAAHVGNYYYFYQGPQAACSDDSTVQAKASNARQLFNEATQHIRQVP